MNIEQFICNLNKICLQILWLTKLLSDIAEKLSLHCLVVFHKNRKPFN
jgi:hypothetical protein